jgi:hypothetical protein
LKERLLSDEAMPRIPVGVREQERSHGTHCRMIVSRAHARHR